MIDWFWAKKGEKPKIGTMRVAIDESYRKEWNVSMGDFVHLVGEDGVPLRPTLYRIGGFGIPSEPARFFMMLKYVEAHYPKDIMEASRSKSPKYLSGRWCIIDSDGNERVEFKEFSSPYLLTDSCIYVIDSEYYNVETGEHYGRSSSTSMKSKDFVFLLLSYGNDESKHGVMKINKKDGTWELFPE